MSGLISNIMKNAQALNFHQRGVETAGNNLAHVNDEHYARQRNVQKAGYNYVSTRWGNIESSAIQTDGLEHLRDKLLDRQVYRAISDRAKQEAELEIMDRARAVMGEEIDRLNSPQSLDSAIESEISSGTLSKTLDGFMNSWHEIASEPNSAATKAEVITSASTLIQVYNSVGERITNLSTDLTAIKAQLSTEADTLLTKVGDLNAQIAKIEFKGIEQAVTFRDERAKALEELSEIMDITVTDISTTNAAGGLSDTGMVGVTAGSANTVLINTTTGAKAVTTFTSDLVTATGGKLAGYDAASNTTTGDLGILSTALDTLASTLVTQVNSAYGTSSDNFFSTSGTTLSTIALDSGISTSTLKTSSLASPSEGDVDSAVAIAALKDTKIATLGSVTFNDYISNTVATFGSAMSDLNVSYDNAELIERMLKEERQGVMGVSIDEEVTDMMRFQRGFQASSRVINVLDELLNTVVNGLVR